MNGIHDLGGLHGLGRVEREDHELLFHSAVEESIFGTYYATVRMGPINIDAYRHGIERMHPAHYLLATYAERRLHSVVLNLIEQGILTREEFDARTRAFASDPHARPPRVENPELTARLKEAISQGRRSTQREVEAPPLFQPGDHVITKNIHPKGHTRLPRYARGKPGVIRRVHGAFVFPDTHAHGLGEQPQYVYSVRFDGRDLWGEDVAANTAVHLDLWESYLAPASPAP